MKNKYKYKYNKKRNKIKKNMKYDIKTFTTIQKRKQLKSIDFIKIINYVYNNVFKLQRRVNELNII